MAALAIYFASGGCARTASTSCADGLICPPNSQCDEVNHRCLGASYCGDGERTSTEVCEGSDLGGETCESLGFYGQTTGLKCSADCKLDKSGCRGRCGDGVVNGPDEQCDGAPPAGKSCLDYGFDRGLLDCTALCGVSTEDCAKDMGWQPAPSPYPQVQTGKRLRSVWGAGPNDVFAAGDAPESCGDSWEFIVHWDGLAWKQMAVPPLVQGDSGAVRQIWGSASNDVWVVGPDAVLHWNGIVWSRTLAAELADSTELQSIWGSRRDDAYVVAAQHVSPSGPQTTILKWNGTAWSKDQYATIPWTQTSPVPTLWQSGPDDAYLTMSSPAVPGSVLHWAGNQWDTLKIGDASAFTSIWGTGASDVYALSEQGAYHWDGTRWTSVPGAPGGYLIKGNSADDIFIVGETPDGKSSSITHWDGRYWSLIAQADEIDDVWGPDLDNLFFTGAAGVFHPTAAMWNPVTAQPADSMWGTGEEVFLAMTSPVDMETRQQPGVFEHTSMRGPFEVLSASAPSPSRIWGISNSDIWGAYGANAAEIAGPLGHWDGSQWSSTPIPFFSSVSGLGGTGPNDVWAVGDNSVHGGSGRGLAHWDGRAWSPVSSSSFDVQAVWAQSPDNAFAVGGDSIQHWAGKTWSEVAYEKQGPWCAGSSLSSCTLRFIDVWGTGANDVYAVSLAPPVVLRFDGERWKATEVPTSAGFLVQLRASGPGNVFLIGYGGLLHLRGGAWESIALPIGLTKLGSLWATPTSLFLSGTSGTYRLDLTEVDCKSPETNCTDGWDNDCDGLQDAADSDCAAAKLTERCANLADDDGDGLADCDDPDCATFPSCRQP